MRTTKAFSVTIPKELLAEIDLVAKEQGRSRSSFLAWLIRQAAKQEILDQTKDPFKLATVTNLHRRV
jgi:metal-responsive CopG/Arc/MetJ family transcriptional regulator